MDSGQHQVDRPYPCWGVVRGDSLEQGDFLQDIELSLPQEPATPGATTQNVHYKTLSVIVMTQSCDLAAGKVSSILLCPWWEFWTFVDTAKQAGKNWGSEIREALRRGNLPGYHLLNEASAGNSDLPLGVVDFHDVYTAPRKIVEEHAKRPRERLRLLPPYKEHLAQAFARFFMRVGLPHDIPREKVMNRPQK